MKYSFLSKGLKYTKKSGKKVTATLYLATPVGKLQKTINNNRTTSSTMFFLPLILKKKNINKGTPLTTLDIDNIDLLWYCDCNLNFFLEKIDSKLKSKYHNNAITDRRDTVKMSLLLKVSV
ncbi:hypothetical protein [Olleya namhaensis]|uniref:hypothetical protein n=1 Tax=Olleya namhaensis TaxID=1144750 RepID=UPI003CD0D860